MPRNGPCLIWHTDAIVDDPTASDTTSLCSARAGGRYSITATAAAFIPSLSELEKAALTSFLVRQRELGVDCPQITSDTIEGIKTDGRQSAFDRADWLLKFLDAETIRLGDTFRFYRTDNSKVKEFFDKLLAYTGSTTVNEVIALCEYCAQQHWIEHKKSERTSGAGNDVHDVSLRPVGYQRLDEVRGTNTASAQAFVAMWFHPSMDEAYSCAVKPAIEDSGYDALRIDQKEHIEKIDDRIVAEIRRSRFVVADFTSEEGKPRGGVYYEAGFAQGLNIPVIWTCRRDCIGDVHFDTRQFNHIVWENAGELHIKLKTRILAVIGEGRRR